MKSCIALSFLLSLAVAMAAVEITTEDQAATYLIIVESPANGVDSASYQLGILTAALGSEEKAKAALIYNYKNVVSGFSARLTPSQLEELKKQPAVTRVMPSVTYHLLSNMNNDLS